MNCRTECLQSGRAPVGSAREKLMRVLIQPRTGAGLAAIAVVVAATMSIGGCKGGGEQTKTGPVTGFELGNQQDFADQRKERPDYRPFE